MPDNDQTTDQPEIAESIEAPTFMVRPVGVQDDVGSDGATYRTHMFHVVLPDGKELTDQTETGIRHVVIPSLPMRIKESRHGSRNERRSRGLLH